MSKTRFFTSAPVTSVTKELTDYENAIKTLNTLQSNASVLKAAERKERHNNVYETIKYLARCGVNLEDFENKIPVIHVSGTKGKGSTCTACETILRSHGYKTGLFTSPHLVCVRERILISGKPLACSNFADRFWEIYNQLINNKENDNDMPAYFKFLTVMALDVFLKEKVDVAIVEVGIGGELDCTNVFSKTPIVGISSLGLDHTSILGNTVEKIAWQKAGIIKPGSKVLTTKHDSSVLNVLKERATEINAKLEIVPNIDDYDINVSKFNPTLKLNASLAIQLANAFLNIKNKESSITTKVCDITMKALQTCQIRGRFQIVNKGNFIYYLDGAHTKESTEYCSQWFNSIVPSDERRVLLFNLTKNRNPALLLEPLSSIKFNLVVFSPNLVTTNLDKQPKDLVEVSVTKEAAVVTSEKNRQAWLELVGECEHFTASCILNALDIIEKSNIKTHVLVTGSLHLVGSVLSVLE